MGKSQTDEDLAVLPKRQRGQYGEVRVFPATKRTFVVNKCLIIQLASLFLQARNRPVGITENNALPLAIESARCIGYKNKPYDKIYTTTIQLAVYMHTRFISFKELLACLQAAKAS